MQDPTVPFASDAELSTADEALLRRVQARVMHEIAADSVRFHEFVAPEDGAWQDFLPGIERKVLHVGPAGMSYLLRFQPGAVLPAHRHPADEETVVIEGALRIGPVLLRAGGWHRVAQDVLDADAVAEGPTTIYVRGAVPKARQLIGSVP